MGGVFYGPQVLWGGRYSHDPKPFRYHAPPIKQKKSEFSGMDFDKFFFCDFHLRKYIFPLKNCHFDL